MVLKFIYFSSFLICIFEFEANQIFYDAKTGAETEKKNATRHFTEFRDSPMMNCIHILFFLGNPVQCTYMEVHMYNAISRTPSSKWRNNKQSNKETTILYHIVKFNKP